MDTKESLGAVVVHVVGVYDDGRELLIDANVVVDGTLTSEATQPVKPLTDFVAYEATFERRNYEPVRIFLGRTLSEVYTPFEQFKVFDVEMRRVPP